jgi:hypothetical protein
MVTFVALITTGLEAELPIEPSLLARITLAALPLTPEIPAPEVTIVP